MLSFHKFSIFKCLTLKIKSLLLPFDSRKTYTLEKYKVKKLNMCIKFICNLLPERVDCPYLARTYNELLSYLKFKNVSGLYILHETV